VSQIALAVPCGVGFYGKIPVERDFVRINAGRFLQAGLDRWFQEAVEHLQRAPLPAQPACFLLSLAAGTQPFVGVLAPGADALGRAFPVVIFAALDQPRRADLSLLPLRLASFFEVSARLATAAHALATAQLLAEIDVRIHCTVFWKGQEYLGHRAPAAFQRAGTVDPVFPWCGR